MRAALRDYRASLSVIGGIMVGYKVSDFVLNKPNTKRNWILIDTGKFPCFSWVSFFRHWEINMLMVLLIYITHQPRSQYT